MQVLKSKRFVVRKSLIGKNQVIEVTFKNGKTAKYNHDEVVLNPSNHFISEIILHLLLLKQIKYNSL